MVTAAGRTPRCSPPCSVTLSLCVLLEQRAAAASAPLASARPAARRSSAARSAISAASPAQPAARRAAPSGRAASSSACRTAMPLVAVVSRAAVQWADHSISFSSTFGPLFVLLRRFRPAFSSAATHFSTGRAGADHEQRQQQQRRLGGCNECAPLRRLCALPAAGRIDSSAAEGRGAAGRGRRAADADCESRPHHAAAEQGGIGNGNNMDSSSSELSGWLRLMAVGLTDGQGQGQWGSGGLPAVLSAPLGSRTGDGSLRLSFLLVVRFGATLSSAVSGQTGQTAAARGSAGQRRR